MGCKEGAEEQCPPYMNEAKEKSLQAFRAFRSLAPPGFLAEHFRSSLQFHRKVFSLPKAYRPYRHLPNVCYRANHARNQSPMGKALWGWMDEL